MAESAGYRALDETSVVAVAAPFAGAGPHVAEEIGDGNLNLVFRVKGATSSVIVKQALPYLRVAGESWQLTRHRAAIERGAIERHTKLAPGMLPALLHFDDTLSALVMEDLGGYLTWRDALIAGQPTPTVAAGVGEYCARVLLGTSAPALAPAERNALRDQFGYSELCSLTENLVFTAPFTGSLTNRYDDEAAHLAESLSSDRSLRAAAAELRFLFKTRGEALIHGDLHSGSVMVDAAGGQARIIDLEFAFFGPIGFDLGMLLANLAFARLAHDEQGSRAYGCLIDGYAEAFWTTFADESHRLWNAGEPWYDQFLATVIADAGRYAGLEMIRRIVGLAHVNDIDLLPPARRLRAQERAVSGGRSLMLGPRCTTFEALWRRATEEDTYA